MFDVLFTSLFISIRAIVILLLQKLCAEIFLGTEKPDQIIKDKYSLRAYRNVATACIRVHWRVLCFQEVHS